MDSPNLDTLIERLPHQPPMQLIDRVLFAAEGQSTCATLLNLERCRLFGDGESALQSYLGVELVAQASAIALLACSPFETPLRGKIAQIKSFRSEKPNWPLGSEAVTSVAVDYALGTPLAMATGQVEIEGEIVCEAALTLTVDL